MAGLPEVIIFTGLPELSGPAGFSECERIVPRQTSDLNFTTGSFRTVGKKRWKRKMQFLAAGRVKFPGDCRAASVIQAQSPFFKAAIAAV